MDKKAIKAKKYIIEFIAGHFGIDPDDITLDMSIRDDLNVAAVEIADLFPKIEEKYQIQIDAGDIENMEIIEDIVDFILDHYEEDSGT